MHITARANHGDVVDRGVVGHAWCADLKTWELREPLSSSGQGFGQLEVLLPFVGDGRDAMLFNCAVGDMPDAARAFRHHRRPIIDNPSLYVGKFVAVRETGETKFFASRNETGGQFIGEMTDPYALHWDGDRISLTSSCSDQRAC